MNQQKSQVPSLRFPEFEEEWENTTIEKSAKVSSGGTPSRTNPLYWGGEYLWVITSEIKGGNKISSSAECITEEGLKNSSAKLFPVNTILLAMYGQGKTRGKTAILNEEASTNQACAAIVPNTDICPKFLLQNLTGRYDELRNLANDGEQKNLSGSLIKHIKFAYPYSEIEQQKIASFLTAVDEKIGQLERKKELLTDYKKAACSNSASKTTKAITFQTGRRRNWAISYRNV